MPTGVLARQPLLTGESVAHHWQMPHCCSGGMMLRYSFDLYKEADAIETAVKSVLADGLRTGDIMSDGMKELGCSEMGDAIADRICN